MRKVKSWQLWDWSAIRGGTIILIVSGLLFLFFLRFPDLLRNKNGVSMTASTNGKFLRFEYSKRLSQNQLGNHETVQGVIVEYSYVVANTTYYNQDNIPTSSENQDFINNVTNNTISTLTIKYNPDNPQKSQIFIKNE